MRGGGPGGRRGAGREGAGFRACALACEGNTASAISALTAALRALPIALVRTRIVIAAYLGATSGTRGVAKTIGAPDASLARNVICAVPLVRPLRLTQTELHASVCARIRELPGPH